MIFQYEEVDKGFEDQKCGDEGGRKRRRIRKVSGRLRKCPAVIKKYDLTASSLARARI